MTKRFGGPSSTTPGGYFYTQAVVVLKLNFPTAASRTAREWRTRPPRRDYANKMILLM